MENSVSLADKLTKNPGQLRRERAEQLHDIYNEKLIHGLNKLEKPSTGAIRGTNIDEYSEADGSPFPIDAWPTNNGKLVRLSQMHGRSIEPAWSGSAIWKDKYGIPYSSISYKGWLAPNPQVYRDSLGFHTKGMFELDYPERVAWISEKMRKNGLATERIVAAKKVEEVWVNGRHLPVNEWKNQLLAKTKDPEEREYIEKVEYIAIKRESQVPWRLWDISALAYYQDEDVIACKFSDSDDWDSPLLVGYKGKNYTTKTEFLERLTTNPEAIDPELANNEFAIRRFQQILSLPNEDLASARWHTGEVFLKEIQKFFAVYKKMGLGQAEIQLNPSDPKDISQFFLDTLPKYMGAYMAKFHKLGFTHGYPHFGNWTTAGTLIDLDSVTQNSELPVTNRQELVSQYRLIDVKRIMYEYLMMFENFMSPADKLLYNLELNHNATSTNNPDNLLNIYQKLLKEQGVGAVPEKPELMEGLSGPWINILYQFSWEANLDKGPLCFRDAQDSFLKEYLAVLSTLDQKFDRRTFLDKIKEDSVYRGYL